MRTELTLKNSEDEKIQLIISKDYISIIETKYNFSKNTTLENYSCVNIEPKRIATIKYHSTIEESKKGNFFLAIILFILAIFLIMEGITLIQNYLVLTIIMLILGTLSFCFALIKMPKTQSTSKKKLIFLDSNEKILFSKALILKKENVNEIINVIREYQK